MKSSVAGLIHTSGRFVQLASKWVVYKLVRYSYQRGQTSSFINCIIPYLQQTSRRSLSDRSSVVGRERYRRASHFELSPKNKKQYITSTNLKNGSFSVCSLSSQLVRENYQSSWFTLNKYQNFFSKTRKKAIFCLSIEQISTFRGFGYSS